MYVFYIGICDFKVVNTVSQFQDIVFEIQNGSFGSRYPCMELYSGNLTS